MRSLLITLVLALSLSGCSAILTRRAPPDYRSRGEFECTQHYVFPIVDGALAALGIWFIASVWQDNQTEYSKVGGTGIGLLWAVGYGMSAGLGYDRVRSCRDAQAEMREALLPREGPVGERDHTAWVQGFSARFPMPGYAPRMEAGDSIVGAFRELFDSWPPGG